MIEADFKAINAAPALIRLLNLIAALRELSPFRTISADEDELLRELIVRWHKGEELKVGDVIKNVSGVSHTTAYRRLVALRDKGFIEMVDHPSDGRIKFVRPGRLAQEYTEELGLVVANFVSE